MFFSVGIVFSTKFLAINFFTLKSVCVIFFPEITHTPTQKSNGRPLRKSGEKFFHKHFTPGPRLFLNFLFEHIFSAEVCPKRDKTHQQSSHKITEKKLPSNPFYNRHQRENWVSELQ